MPIEVDEIFNITSDDSFNEIALKIFRYQAKNEPTYRSFLNHLGCIPDEIDLVDKIPFLPIQFFKSKKVISDNLQHELLFKSSGTTQTGRSCHYVYDSKLYEQSFKKGFSHFFGSPGNYTFLALLPSYLEQGESSLTYMINQLIEESNCDKSGFYLNHEELPSILNQLQKEKKKVILFGVTYALLDLMEDAALNFPELIVMETGGMKGRRKEMTKSDLHTTLKRGFGVEKIYSEYGMTEMLSQAYSLGGELFSCPPWLKITLRQIDDPLSKSKPGKTGGINVIDLANIHSCSFIATQDLGRLNENNQFQILGRFDHSDVRGCNLLIAE